MTTRVALSPEAERHLNEIDDWITAHASVTTAHRFVAGLLDHIRSIAVFPLAGQPRDDVRPGMRTTIFKRRTVIAYVVDQRSDGRAVTVIGIFHGGQDWERALLEDEPNN